MNSPTQRFFGALLMAIGGLVAGVSGLCVLTLGSTLIWTNITNLEGLFSVLLLILVFGVIPFAGGASLFLWGRRLRR